MRKTTPASAPGKHAAGEGATSRVASGTAQHESFALSMARCWIDASRLERRGMNDSGWPFFSFCELLRPEPGWKIDHAILATYSADLTVITAALLALSGCDCDDRRTGSRLELVRAIEKLRNRVRVLVHPGRVAKPKAPPPILAVLDNFLCEIRPKARDCSWHPKAALLRFTLKDGAGIGESQWRLWIGSRNLTKSMNREAGMVLTSRPDDRGRRIEGVADLGAQLAARADLASFPARSSIRRIECTHLGFSCWNASRIHPATRGTNGYRLSRKE